MQQVYFSFIMQSLFIALLSSFSAHVTAFKQLARTIAGTIGFVALARLP